MTKPQAGFTIIELMVVIAIMGIAAAVATPNFIEWRQNQQLASTARSIYARLQSAKSIAVDQNCYVYTEFDTANGTYRSWRDGDINGDGNIDHNETWDPGFDTELATGRIPASNQMTNASFSGNDFVTFAPSGLPRRISGAMIMGNVIIANDHRQIKVIVNTGGVRLTKTNLKQ
ncbi:MAG: GspH/FimT family pseudopilin [Thermodesulfobacteriota bacterium]|nr:GspH/FimT family pseudopilin [Thermodesulfobacteriota bacterium]